MVWKLVNAIRASYGGVKLATLLNSTYSTNFSTALRRGSYRVLQCSFIISEDLNYRIMKKMFDQMKTKVPNN